jgi:hypothetical protein
MPDQPKPLIVLTADHNALFGLTALLRRADELGIHPIDFDAYPHPNRDNGVRRRADVFLRSFLQWEHALVVFDREGSGSEDAAEWSKAKLSPASTPMVGKTGAPLSPLSRNSNPGFGTAPFKPTKCWGGQAVRSVFAIGCSPTVSSSQAR